MLNILQQFWKAMINVPVMLLYKILMWLKKVTGDILLHEEYFFSNFM